MERNNLDVYDQKIKQGLEALAADIPVPDVAQAFKRHKGRREQKNRFRGAIAAAAILLLLVPALTSPTQAFKGFLRITITKMITETSQLFQRADEGAGGVVIEDVERKQYDNLEQLKKEQAARAFIPTAFWMTILFMLKLYLASQIW